MLQLFYFISIFILLTRMKATEALIHRVSNYPDLLLGIFGSKLEYLFTLCISASVAFLQVRRINIEIK